MAYIKFENLDTQRAFEEYAKGEPDAFKVVRRFRVYGDKVIGGDLESIADLLRENEEFLRERPGRFAVYPQTDEERARLDAFYERLGDLWERED